MKSLLRIAAFAAVCALVSTAALAIDRSECKQYGGTRDCWPMLLGPWKYDACGEVGTVTFCAIPRCAAQGETWNASDRLAQGN